LFEFPLKALPRLDVSAQRACGVSGN
jgi:hypothetical protein